MSKVTKMSIQGIRSFGPDDRDRGIIKFHTPLTLILGPNGTGKTTVIECLKYMTTGNQPPGTSAGSGRGAFIHDPKIANEPTVNAQVKLQFYDVQQKLRTVTRSLKAVQKDKSGIQVTTLDSLLTFRDNTGEERSITSKCIDLNKEMASLMGVSRAVLENVIFCHQEDSSWPMSEGKVLKEKFDDIFASTRYVKAIDSIAKLRKDQAVSVRLYQNDVEHLGRDKDKALNLQKTLQEKQSEYRGRQQLIEDITKKINPIQEKLEAINEREADIWKLHNEKENVKFKKEQCEKTQEELLSNIENIFTGTLEDLELKMHEFQTKLKERENMLDKYERDVRSLEREMEEFNEEKAKLLQDQGRLEQEQQQHKENIQNRDRLVQKLATDYNMEGFSGRLSDEDADEFMKELGVKAKVVKDKAMKTRADFEDEEDALQKELDKVRRKKTALETELAMKKETMQNNQSKIREIGQKLKQMDSSAGRLEEVAENLKKAERELAAFEKSVDLSALKKDVTKLQEEKLDLDTALKKLDAERDRLHSESSSRTQLEMWKKDKSTKTDQIRRLKNKNEESLTHLLGHVPADGGMHRALDEYLRTQKRQTQRDATALQELRMKLSSKETEKRSLTEKLAEKEREKKGYENEIGEVCDSQNFDKGLQSLQTKMQQSQENKGLLTGMLHLFNKYIDKLKKEDPPCPLCHRGFESEQEVNELKDELEGKLRQVPEKMEQYTKNFEESQRKYDRMQQLLPNKEKIADLDENTIPNLQAKLESVKGQVVKLEEEITESQESLEMRQIDEATANSLLPDMNNIDRLHVEIRDLDRKINSEQAKLSGSDGDRSIDIVNDDREDIKMRLESTGNELEMKRARITEYTERMGHMHSEVNGLMAEKNEIDRDLQDRIKLEDSRADLIATTTTLTSEVEEAEQALDPLHNQIQSLVQRKDKKTLQKEKQLEEDKDQLTKIKLSRNDVEKMQADIRRYYQTGREKKLEKSKEEIKRIESEAVKVEEKKKTCITNVNKIRQDLDTQKIRERELSDNRQLLQKKQEAETLAEQLVSLREKLKGIDVTKLERNKAQYKEELEKLTHSRSQYTGQQEEALTNIKDMERSLAAPDMKTAEAKYKEKKIQLRTTELANSDLEKYHKALDWTIMSYHKTKMAEINKIIRELWRNTYRGNDIDTIEIQSDEDKGTATKRRTYNYRVVMVKGGASLDMRGRCSAGQKSRN